jgi:Family of unknown function (DUF6353)
MMKFVPEAVGRVIARNALLAQKTSPEILFGVGIVGAVASTVLACRATLKMNDVLEEAKATLDTARTLEHNEYSEKDRRRDISLIYFQTSVKVIRLYSPAILVGGLSIAALTSSHNILTRRNAALTAAYAALDKGFREYRARVVAKYGEEEDRNLRYGTREITIDDPDTKKKTTVVRVGPEEPSIYARFFDNASQSWSKEPEYNLIFLKAQQNWANDLLHARGHVFLNEVYDMLGLDRSQAGAVVGWLLTKNGSTDNFVNFGVFDDSERARDFVNGFEGAILLDFNVDGVIYDKLDNIHREALSWQRGKSLNR